MRQYILGIFLLIVTLSANAQKSIKENKAIDLIKQLNLPLDKSNCYYFVSELDCSTCVEKLLNNQVAKQDKNKVYIVYYTPSKKRIPFSSTLFKDFIKSDHFYLTRNATLYDILNALLPIGRGPYYFQVDQKEQKLVGLKSFSVE